MNYVDVKSDLHIIGRFASRMLAWFLSRVMSASVSFRVAGFNCLRDVNIKFRKVTFLPNAIYFFPPD